MPEGTEKKLNVVVPTNLVSEHLTASMLKTLLEDAKGKSLDVKIANHAGQPFEIITQPGGSVCWGIGGSINLSDRLIDPVVTPER